MKRTTFFILFTVLFTFSSAQISDEEALVRARLILRRYPLVDG